MIVIPGRIPITIHPFFWLFATILGWLMSQTFAGTIIWLIIIFVSVLFHEFGHALTAVLFKQKTQIQLVALGGLTTFDGPKLAYWKQFIIVLNGPIAGFMLGLLATFFLQFTLSPLLYLSLRWAQIANFFWSAVNLLPVLPMDGGQLLRIVLEGLFGIKGFKASLIIGATLSILLCFYFFLMQNFLAGAFFFLFAFQSFDLWRKSKKATSFDRDDECRKELIRGEELLQEGNKEGAKRLFEDLLKKAPGGMLAGAAAQYLSFLYAQQGRNEEAYHLLLPLKKELSSEALCLLHKLAAEFRNPEVVAELSAECYQIEPNRDVAMRNARAFAELHQPKPAGGWLQTVWQYGSFDVQNLLKEEAFAKVCNDPEFKKFLENLR